MKYYYWGEINGREFLYKNFIRRDNEPDDDLQADVSSPPSFFPFLLPRKHNTRRKGWELVRSSRGKHILYFLLYSLEE